MKFWQLLRWIGSALVLVVAVLACIAALLAAQQTPEAATTQERSTAPAVQSGNNRGL